MADDLEDKYSKFQRNTGIDLRAEIAAGGGDGLDNYYTKDESNVITDELDDRVTILEGSSGPDLTDYYNKTEADSLLEDKADTVNLTNHTGNTSNPHNVTKAQVGLANVDNTSDANKPISSATQTALSGKSDSSHNHDSRYYTETETDTLLGGKANTSHTHAAADVSSGTLNIARIPTGTSGTTVSLGNHSHTKTDVGLSNVDNTSDVNKPVSTAAQTALDGKQPLDSDLTAIAGLAPSNDDVIQRKSGVWTNRTPAQLKTDLSLTKTDVGLANVDNTSDVNKPISTATQTAINAKLDTTTFNNQTRTGITGPPRAVKPSIPLTVDGAHSAFPGVCKLSNGNLLLTWRQGTDHFTTRDGAIKTSISTDLGRTWSAASTAIAYAGDGVDYRDPSVSMSSDGTRVYLTYFKGTASLAAAGCFLRISTNNGSTWGSEIRIDNSMPYAAICAPLLELANGNLLAFFYGRSGAETQDSVWYARSTNNGASWAAPVRLANGTTDARHYQEPWAVRQGNNTVVFFRWGASEIGKVHSTDATATTWQAGSSQFAGTGRPSAVWTSYGNIIVTYRGVGTGQAGSTMIRSTSSTIGTTWNPGVIMQTQLYGGMMTYTCPFEVNPGQIICPWSEEISGGGSTSKLLVTYINEGGGETPVGPVPSPAIATVTNYDNLAFSTQFHQPDGSLGYPWQSAGGAATVSNGILNSSVADNTPDNVIVNCGSLNQRVDADFMWTGQSGFGIYLRWVDSNNHILITPETSAGNLRIYTRIAGTLTQRAVLADAGFIYEANWNKISATMEGFRVKFWVNDDVVTQYLIDGTMNSALQGTMVGIKLNAQSGATNQCRRFSAFAL